jgi:superfamily II DNA or RNA helicase
VARAKTAVSVANGKHAALDDLIRGVRLTGLTASGTAEVVATEWHGKDAVTVVFRTEDGDIHQQVLLRSQTGKLRVVSGDEAARFSGDGADFKLGMEALRIQMAAQFDPMLAVATSDLDPLPHQIQAVYGDLLGKDQPLRFLLADDPGAGKTIMAGLFIKELALRGDLQRCLIVVPGGLVDQWQDELHNKLGLRFDILTADLVAATPLSENPFHEYPRLLVRMDQVARNESLLAHLARTEWDVVVVDEAHKMAAHYFGGELKTTKRYQLGQMLGGITRHLLLMTATPHAGKEEDFQAFLALLDPDRFEGRYRQHVHDLDTSGLMCRRVKEELLTFDGKPLFPERRATTLPFELSAGEMDLYEAVTHYVRAEMGRADQLKAAGEGRRGNTVGFALTVLQRRLASSPEAILRSLERRRDRLTTRLNDIQAKRAHLVHDTATDEAFGAADIEDVDDALDELGGEELEELEEEVVDAATAARTADELKAEIAVLDDLVVRAKQVRYADTDRKWTELRDLLLEPGMLDRDGARHKILIFTEHRDTLNYLVGKIRMLLGREDVVAAIHGGVSREGRRAVQDAFRQDPALAVLVATDAAGEGLNLQRAHLMVNYDLPWNPNRIEQRFGRIHRIGQTEVCHLWNLLATATREGDVFNRLLAKIEEQRQALGGKVFDVLGEAFQGTPLRTLLLDAIRYGDRPEIRAKLHQVIDERVGEGLDKLLAERALYHDLLTVADVEKVRLQMEEARARRLQPHYISAFFRAAFTGLGGRIGPREADRFEISGVPPALREQRQAGGSVLPRYQRVTFGREGIQPDIDGDSSAVIRADLLAPGHPLLDAVVQHTAARCAEAVAAGTILIDRLDPAEDPRVLIALGQEIADGNDPPRPVLRRFEFTELLNPARDADTSAQDDSASTEDPGRFYPPATARPCGPAPYLDYEIPQESEREAVADLAAEPWLASARHAAVSWAVSTLLPASLAEVSERITTDVERTRRLVRQRLTHEINYWDARQGELFWQQQHGKKIRMRPETAGAKARDLEQRLTARLAELDREEHLQPSPPVAAAAALVVPQGMLDRLAGLREMPVDHYAKDTREVDERAVAAVLAAERDLGRNPEAMAHNNPGYDIRSRTPDGHWLYLEVKGRIAGAKDFVVTRNEVMLARNTGPRHRLAMVEVSPEGAALDRVRYVLVGFDGIALNDFAATAVVLKWKQFWARGENPR